MMNAREHTNTNATVRASDRGGSIRRPLAAGGPGLGCARKKSISKVRDFKGR
jgi:hypothetical protein